MSDASASLARYADLAGRVTFISDGATGIGRDLVAAFTAQEAWVVFADIDIEAGRALQAETGAEFLECDVTDETRLQDAIDHADAQGGLEILVNNAARDQRMPVADVTPDEWSQLVDVNLRHQFFAAQRACHHMIPRGRGSIINFGSVAPEIMVPNLTVYNTCKSAIRGLTRSLAKDMGGHGIRVNSILPGAILTPKQRAMWYPDQASIDVMVDQQCLKRELCGQDVAQMALFLASDASSACTAQDFIVDGGIL